METRQGSEGGVRLGWADAAAFRFWTLDAAGPDLYILRADCRSATPAWLGAATLRVWVRIGALRWAWTVTEVAYDEAAGRLVTTVGRPEIGPATPA